MRKLIIVLFILTGIVYAQPYSPVKPILDTLTIHRTDINANIDSLAQHRTEIDALGEGIEFTGDVSFGDNDTLAFGAGNDLILYSTGSLGNIGGASSIYLSPNNTSSWLFNSSGNFTPVTTSTFDIGSSDRYVRGIYADTISVDTLLSMPDGADIKLGDGSDLQMTFSGTAGSIIQQNANLSIYGTGAYSLYFGTNTVLDWEINSTGNFTPYTNEGADIGSTSKQVDTVYTEGINLDGTPITASGTELNYVDGATSSLQGQITELDDSTSALRDTTTDLRTDVNANTVITTNLGSTIQDSIEAYVHYINLVIVYPQTNNELVPILLGNKQITEIYAVIQEGTSVVWDLMFSTNMLDGSGNSLLDAAVTTTYSAVTNTRNSYTADINDTYDGDVESNQYVWLDIGTVTGTVKSLTVTLGVIEGD